MTMYKPFPTEKRTVKIAYVAICVSLLFVLSFFEGMLNFNFGVPGVRLGLSNLVIVFAVSVGSFSYGFLITLLKVFINSLFFGGFSSFLFTAFGSFASFFAMWILKKALKDKISCVGISVGGGFFHINAQYVASFAVMKSVHVFKMLPYAVLFTLVSSVFVGIVVQCIIKSLKDGLKK